MIKTRYMKLTGLHAGHTYEVTAPASETAGPMQWSLQSEADTEQKLIVAEDELDDKARWQALG